MFFIAWFFILISAQIIFLFVASTNGLRRIESYLLSILVTLTIGAFFVLRFY